MPQKPIKRSMKNTIKNLVKESQRVHDYKSPFGAKFWNKILKDSKFLAKNHKVFDKNLPPIVERDYERYNQLLETETDEKKIEVLKEKIYQLSFFVNGEWRNIIDMDARVKEEYKDIIWKNRTKEDPYNT